MKKVLLILAFTLLPCASMFAQDGSGETPEAQVQSAETGVQPSGPLASAFPRDSLGRFSLKHSDLQLSESAKDKPPLPDTPDTPSRPRGFNWSGAVKESMLFLAVQHGYAMTQPKTRHALKGPFFRDYFDSVKALHGWDDGGRFFTNYIAHPMEGAMYGFIQVQNDTEGKALKFSNSKRYWASRGKAMAWAAAWSTQFEIGPLSQASIGNVGLKGKQTYVDIVITPTVGTAWLVAEDFLDRYVGGPLERRFSGRYVRIFSRMLLNPVRTMANLIRVEKPWYRERGLR